MGWQDAPIVGAPQSGQPKWASAPVIGDSEAEPEPQLRGGFANIPGATLDPLAHLASSAVAAPVAGIAGLGTMGARALGLTDAQPADVVGRVQSALTFQPRTQAGAATTEAVTYPFQKYAQFADWAGQQAANPQAGGNLRANIQSGGVIPKDYAGSPAAGALVNTAVQLAPAALLRRPAGGVESPNVVRPARVGPSAAPGKGPTTPTAPAAQRPAGLARVPGATPSLEELSAQATAAYKRASDAGITIAPGSFANLKNRIGVALQKEGIDQTLHPATTAAFKRIAESKGTLSLDQLETLRKIANDAKGAPAAADKRLASIVVDEIDDYVAQIGRKDVTSGDPKAAAALKEARNLYSRKMKAEEIGRLIERAEISAPNFSASGMENALRTEFRALAKDKRRIRRFNAEEQAAIKKVAMGGRMENALRMIGKMAPTGAVSGMFGILSTAAVPGGAALPIAGLAGRYAATRMTKRNAMAAEELMRRGPPRQSSGRNTVRERDKVGG